MSFANKALFCVLLAWSLPAVAEPCVSASPANPGDSVACQGVILPSAWAQEALECLQVDRPGCQARLELVQEVRASCELTLEKTIAKANQTADAYEVAIRRAAEIERSWWRSPVIWAMLAGTAGLGLGLAAGIAF